MKTSEALRAAKAKIDRPEKWTRGVTARRATGLPVSAANDDAVCWCALGALWSLPVTNTRANRSLANELPVQYGRAVDQFNDAPTTTHADILALFDRAIAAAESRGE